MKSTPYELDGKLFRYDFDRCVAEYIAKAGAEELADEAEWKKTHDGRSLLDIDSDGYMILSSVGLMKENWSNKDARDEYLSEWAFELDEELAYLAADFAAELAGEERYTPSSTAGDYSPSNPWDAPGMSIRDFI